MSERERDNRKSGANLPETWERFIEKWTYRQRLYHSTIAALLIFSGRPREAHLVGKPQPTYSMVDIALQERTTDFATLNEITIVAFWASLEASVNDFLVAWLLDVPEAKELDEVRNVKVSLLDFEAADSEERMGLVIQELAAKTRAPFRRGVDQFEVLLQVFGLSGPVPEQIGRNLYELSEIRNVIMHRSSTVDKRLLRACPWLRRKLGERVQVNTDDFDRYYYACSDYLKLLPARATAYLEQRRQRK